VEHKLLPQRGKGKEQKDPPEWQSEKKEGWKKESVGNAKHHFAGGSGGKKLPKKKNQVKRSH